MESIHTRGIDFILWFQQFSPHLDNLFKALTFAGEEDFFFLLMPLMVWCIDRRKGLRLAVVFLLSSYVGTVIKELTNLPRPYQVDSRIKMLFETSGKAFPSLHTQNTVVIWGFIASQFRKWWVWVVAIILFMGVPLSRVYLGLHFPADLAGGYVIGTLLLMLFLHYGADIEDKFHLLSLSVKLLIAGLLPLLLYLGFPTTDPTVSSATGVVFGAWIGIILERLWVRYKVHSLLWKRVCCFIIGITGVMLLRMGLKLVFTGMQPESFFRFLRYGFIGVWFTLGAPWVFMKLKLAYVDS